jgi:hypothetical protein
MGIEWKIVKMTCICSYPEVLISLLAENWKAESFIQPHASTLGADFLVKRVEKDGKFMEIQIWVTSPLRGFKKLRERFYRGTNLFIWWDPQNLLDKRVLDHFLGYREKFSPLKHNSPSKIENTPIFVYFIGKDKSLPLKEMRSIFGDERVKLCSRSEFLDIKTTEEIFNFYEPFLFEGQ